MRGGLGAESRLIPTRESRTRNRRRVERYGPGRFESYRDYFLFVHVDPVLRWWHAVGMVGGILLFPIATVRLDPLLFLIGVVSFYGVGYVSHVVYDGGAARTDPRYFWPSIPWIVEINLRTLTGRFESSLRDLVERHPFVREAYGMDAARAGEVAEPCDVSDDRGDLRGPVSASDVAQRRVRVHGVGAGPVRAGPPAGGPSSAETRPVRPGFAA